MSSNNKKALTAGTWYVISNFMIKAIALLTTPIITRLLTPEDYGLSTTYLSVFNIITIIGTLDLYSSVQIANFDFEDNELDSFMSSILGLSSLSVFLLYMVVRIFPEFSLQMMGLDLNLIGFLFLNVLLTNAYTLLQTKHRSQLKYKKFVLMSVFVSILSPIISIILINRMEENLYLGRIVGNALPQMILSIFIFGYIIFKGKTLFNKVYWNYALKISIPLIPHHLSGSILSQSDRIMINNLVGATQVGLYSLAYSYSTILQVLWTSFNQAWVPWFYGKMKEQKYEEIKYFVKPYSILFSLFYMGMVGLGPEAIQVFGPSQYQSGMWIVPPVLLGIFFQFLYSLYVNIEFYLKKTQYIAIGTFIAAGVNIVLNFIFIPKYGYIAAAYTTLIGYIILFILHYYIVKNWINTDIIGIKFLLTWLLVIISFTIIMMFLYQYKFYRYVFLGVSYLAIIVPNLRKFKNILSTFKNNK